MPKTVQKTVTTAFSVGDFVGTIQRQSDCTTYSVQKREKMIAFYYL